ncbi:DUF6550 family protein [uncultured Dysosmobacter sp.]|uniref:DUF6550 family protein n=1 Tax=uncultured Dysosmobacter sp. TaxID=2591384 RepID=UPI002634DA10|nr:DUF6550 family protein [uncultured Dysosmobacter sp.]
MKKLIIGTVFIACLTLCAAVWPQTEATRETTHAPLQVTAASAPEPAVEDIAADAETTPLPEEERIEIPQPQADPIREVIHEPGPVPEEIPATTEVQPTPAPVSAPTLAPMPASSQTVTDPKPGDMVYVPGFGWLECQGPGEVIHDESIYENGNKIGIMG